MSEMIEQAREADELALHLAIAVKARKGARLSVDQCAMVNEALKFYAGQLRMHAERSGDPAGIGGRLAV